MSMSVERIVTGECPPSIQSLDPAEMAARIRELEAQNCRLRSGPSLMGLMSELHEAQARAEVAETEVARLKEFMMSAAAEVSQYARKAGFLEGRVEGLELRLKEAEAELARAKGLSIPGLLRNSF